METLQIQSKGDYVVVQLDRGKANPINGTMVKELTDFFTTATIDDSIKGVVITGKEGFFSAGLDILELYEYDKDQMKIFWDGFTDLIAIMASFPKPFISAITGHSPAGGCIIAICSDYRVMAKGEKFRIGLNEIPVGIVVPNGILELYSLWLGKGRAYGALMEGKMFSTAEALEVGLVEQLVEPEEVLARAEEKMQQYLALPYPVWVQTKKQFRASIVEKVQVSDEEKIATLKMWWSDESRKALGGIVQFLKSKQKKKA